MSHSRTGVDRIEHSELILVACVLRHVDCAQLPPFVRNKAFVHPPVSPVEEILIGGDHYRRLPIIEILFAIYLHLSHVCVKCSMPIADRRCGFTVTVTQRRIVTHAVNVEPVKALCQGSFGKTNNFSLPPCL